jgi:hypothetical protein
MDACIFIYIIQYFLLLINYQVPFFFEFIGCVGYVATTNQPILIEELPGPLIEARQETTGATRHRGPPRPLICTPKRRHTRFRSEVPVLARRVTVGSDQRCWLGE